MPSTVRTARAPTDLKPNLIRVKKRDDERARIGRWRLAALSQKKRGRLQCGVCPEKRMAKQERRWTREGSASLMAITSHLPKGWVSERYSYSDSSACLRLRMRCATPMHSTAPPAIQVMVTPLRPVSGSLEPFLFWTVRLTTPSFTVASFTSEEGSLVTLTVSLLPLSPSGLARSPSAVEILKVKSGSVL